MNTHTTWVNRTLLALLWFAVTAGIAFLVARNAGAGEPATDVNAPVPPIAAAERATVTLTERTIAPVVSGDGTVMRDTDEERWLLVAPATPADVAYRLLDPPIGVKALIDGGPAGFDCAWAGLGQSDGSDAMPSATPVARFGMDRFASLVPLDSGDEAPTGGDSSLSGGGVTMRCEIPDDVRVVSGLTGTMVLAMQEPTGAMALPASAVVGSEGQGQVVVVNDDGATSVRPVELGVSDAFWIEITGGLEAGEQVLEAPTQHDFGTGLQ